MECKVELVFSKPMYGNEIKNLLMKKELSLDDDTLYMFDLYMTITREGATFYYEITTLFKGADVIYSDAPDGEFGHDLLEWLTECTVSFDVER